VAEQAAPVFEVRIVVSTVLLQNTLTPLVQSLAIALSVSFVVAVLLAVLVSNLAFRPLARVGETIDRIARGESPEAPRASKQDSEEVAVLESKLHLLGQRFRGAQEDAVELRGNIERLLEGLRRPFCCSTAATGC